MDNFEKNLEKYAELVVKVGVNVQPGQVLIVNAPIETVELTRHIVAKAYDAGAKYVQVDWEDEKPPEFAMRRHRKIPSIIIRSGRPTPCSSSLKAEEPFCALRFRIPSCSAASIR